MLNRDEENGAHKRRRPARERLSSESLGASDSGDSARNERSSFRPVTQPGPTPTSSLPSPFYRVPSGSGTRRGPSYPAWEKPPTPFIYPRLRGREARRPVSALWPVIFAAIAVVALLFAVVVLPALLRHAGGAGVASPSASASQLVGVPGNGTPSPSIVSGGSVPSPSLAGNGSSGPPPSFQQYTVKAGDTVTKIARKYSLKSWELLLANPVLADNPDNLKIGLTLNIPQPGQLTPPPASPSAP
jgi:LysM repeat protein